MWRPRDPIEVFGSFCRSQVEWIQAVRGEEPIDGFIAFSALVIVTSDRKLNPTTRLFECKVDSNPKFIGFKILTP